MNYKVLTILSSLCLLAATSGMASAQSETEAPTELRPGVLKILCEHFPLNSRCVGNTDSSTPSETPAEETPAEAPAEETPAEAPAEETPASETPAEETPAEAPAEETPAEAPAEETPAEAPAEAAPAEETPAEAPSSEAPTDEMEASSEANTDETILEVASANGSFKTLIAAIQAANLTETLSGDGPFTVFAPTEEAFAALPSGTVDTLLKPENKDKLVKILTYHVVPAKAVSTDLESGEVTTVAGSPVKVTVEDGAVTINNASVVQADVMGSNGVIHVIDKVLLPPNL